MRALWSACLALVIALCASGARADRITQVSATLDGDDAIVRVDADAAVGSPRLHLDRGAVRLWFPGLAPAHFIERRADGHAVRRVSARPGAADTGLVVVELGDARRLASGDVRVSLDGTRAIVRIARAALPPASATALPQSEPGAGASAPTAVDSMPTVATVVPVATTVAATPAPATTRDDTSDATGRAPRGATEVASSVASRAIARTDALRPPRAMAGFAGPIPDAKSAGMRTVGLVVALLLGLALFGRWLKQKRAARPAAAIRVVATHRLGAKHQLVVVRAFDQEILLSINGGETRRIASRRADDEAEQVVTSGATAASGAPSSGRLLALVPAAMPTQERAPSRRETPSAPDAESSSPFGAEFARLVRGIAPTAPVTRPAVSDSVSGLVRLREARGQR